MRHFAGIACFGLLLIGLSACAAGSDAALQTTQQGSGPSILLGLWHGLIAPIVLVVEFIHAFTPGTIAWSPHFYETRNTGVLYDLGFFVGVIAGPSMIWRAALRRR